MSEEKLADYAKAVKRFNDATVRLKGLRETVHKVDNWLAKWEAAGVSEKQWRGPDHRSALASVICHEDGWPKGSEISEAMTEVHEAARDLVQRFRGLTAVEQEGVKDPMSAGVPGNLVRR